LKTSEKERTELSKQLDISQHDIKNYKSKLKEYMTDNSSLRDELNQLKDKCDGISNGSQMERDRLMKEMDGLIHLHQIQLGERERGDISHEYKDGERETE
jgi:regulator of replication initiation timing